jgi:hypothetical protein
VRLTTLIGPDESDAAAEARLRLRATQPRKALSGEPRRGRPVSTHQARHSASSA